MSDKRNVHVVAGIVSDANRYLIARRAIGKASAGLWEFPGGKVEPGESSAAALERELREELDICVAVQGAFCRNQTVVGQVTIDLECLLVTLEGPRPISSTDHDLLKWVTTDGLAEHDWCAPDMPAVRRLAGLH